MTKSILFLDFDGVLLPFHAYDDVDTTALIANPREYMQFIVDRTPKENLDAIAKFGETHQFVIISTWRHLFPKEDLMDYMDRIGLKQFFHEDPVAKSTTHFLSKENDIEAWMEKHGEQPFLVIDDHDMGYATNQIVPDPFVGYLG